MTKRTLLLALFFFSFAFISCRKTEQQEYPKLPSLNVTMTPMQLDSIINDYNNKVSAFAVLIDSDGDTLFQDYLTYIKTRGNTTFKEQKKSIAIKFPEKQKLFGLNKNKTFVLLANAHDESFIRNAIGLDLARAFGIPATNYAYLTLYINGKYNGLYQMTNKVDVGKHTLHITDLEDLNEHVNPKPLKEYEWYGSGRKKQAILRKGVLLDHNPDDITGGYLLDNSGPIDQYSKSVSGFVSEAEDNIRIRSPKHASLQEVEYIAKRYNEMESAVHAPDGIHPVTGKHYSEYIDIESFARYYLINELLRNPDGGWTSFMMYKDTDSIDPKIYAGPAWDYDRILDNPRFQGQSIIQYNEFFADRKQGDTGRAHSGGLLHYLCKHEDFRQAVKKCYLNDISSICHSYIEENPSDSLYSLLLHEADHDNMIHNNRYSGDYKTAIIRVTEFLRKRIEFLDWYYLSTEDERVVVTYTFKRKKHTLYFPLGEPIEAPQIELLYNHTPVYELYYAGTDSLVPNGTVFHSSQKLDLRKREPTKREVQIRRIRKKLTKLGIIKH